MSLVAVPLESPGPMDPAIVGWKALNLARLAQAGLPVPPGFVIPRTYLFDLLRANRAEGAYNHLLSHAATMNRFAKLRNLIAGLKIPDEDRARLAALQEKLGGRLAVRTSAPDEDTGQQTMAGLYASVLDVDSPSRVEEAVLECLASSVAFGVWRYSRFFGQGVALILQSYVPFEWGGVAFSRHPLTGDGASVVISCGQGPVENIVSGSISGTLLTVGKGDEPAGCGPLPPSAVKSLVEFVTRIEEWWGSAVDVEWGVADHSLWLVQARPIRDYARVRGDRWHGVIDVDEENVLRGKDLGPLTYMHERWMDKKHLVRRTCRRLGLDVPPVVYASFPDRADGCDAVVSDILSRLRTPVLEIYDGERHRRFHRERLADVCRARTDGFTRPTIVRVQELPRAQACGYATVDSDGNVYVETLPGGMMGFRLNHRPTAYLIDREGGRLRQEERAVGEYVVLDMESASFQTVTNDVPEAHSLPDRVLSEVARLARRLYAELGEVRIEWTLCDDQVTLLDLSEETQPLVETRYPGQVLSSGSAEGPVCVLDDLTTFDTLFRDPEDEVDVVPRHSFTQMSKSEACRRLVRRNLRGLNRPIVVAEYPRRTLAILVGHVSGFIFERGALLAHLPIILRESRVPATILQDARSVLSTGEVVRLSDGSVEKVT